MALLKVIVRTYFFDVDSIKMEKVSDGRWEITFDDYHKFLVVGGRGSGGASNEWFCYRPEMFGETWVPCKSMVAAIRMGCTY
jgi:hypothetical protein